MIASCAFVKWVKLTLKGALLLPCASHGLGYGYGLASSALLWFLALMHMSFNVLSVSVCRPQAAITTSSSIDR